MNKRKLLETTNFFKPKLCMNNQMRDTDFSFHFDNKEACQCLEIKNYKFLKVVLRWWQS
jgi:hypothetical protein